MSKRLARFSEQLKRELSELIRLEVRDPRVGSVTITGVDVSADLGVARIFVRSMVGEELTRSLEGLEAAAPFLRTALGKSLHVRRVPELRFQEDRSYAGAQRIEEVLAEVLPAGAAEGDPPNEAEVAAADAAAEPGDEEGGAPRSDMPGADGDEGAAREDAGA